MDTGTIPEDGGEGNFPGEWQDSGGPDWNKEDTPWDGHGDAGDEEEEDWENAEPQEHATWGSPANASGGWGGAPPPPGSQTWTSWGQEAGIPGPRTHAPPSLQIHTSQVRHSSGNVSAGAASAAGWQSWGAEAAARGFKASPTFLNQGNTAHRVAFAEAPTLIPSQSQMSPRQRQAILNTLGPGVPFPPQHQQPPQSKQEKKGKKSKQAPVDQGWGTPNNQDWGEHESGWDQQEDPAWDHAEWDDAEAGESIRDGPREDRAGRREFLQSLTNAFVPSATGRTSYPMTSRTFAYANDHSPNQRDALEPGLSRMRTGIADFARMDFLQSNGEALRPAEMALFGRERKARERIHWQFPHDKDQRVRSVLVWIQDAAHGIGAFGVSISFAKCFQEYLSFLSQLDKFLQTRERGALFVNASYIPRTGPNEPALDWLGYEDAVETRDRLIQESVGFYDPAMQVVVFVMLPSKTGNSVAMWRRKINVPNSVRLAHLQEIEIAKAALKKDYPVVVDEILSVLYSIADREERYTDNNIT
jgi:hypothetical protein